MKNKRNKNIDVIKGLCIILVVVIHASTALGGNDAHVILHGMARFSVPYFIMTFVIFP